MKWKAIATGRVAKAVGAMLVVAALIGGGLALRQALQPKVYFISGLSLKYFKADKVPEAVVVKLEGLSGKEFVSKAELVEAIRAQVGAEAFGAHAGSLTGRIRTRNCWPTTSPLPVHSIRDSRGHPLHDRFGIELLVPQQRLPPVPTQLEFLPGGEGLLVLGKFGHLTWLGADWAPRMVTQVPDVFAGGEDQGALGLALDPGFARNRFFYVAFVNTKGQQNVIQRLTLSPDGAAVTASRVDILRLKKDRTQEVHGIGALHFNARGELLVQVGKPGDTSEEWADYEGKVLALKPGLGASGGYEGRPVSFLRSAWAAVRRQSTLPVVQGLRSPFSGTQWRGHLVIGDVGSSGPYSHEEVNIVMAEGADYGWPECQDPALHGDYAPPVISYRRTDPLVTVDDPQAIASEGRSVIVGVVYEGAAQDRYQGTLDRRLIYGDFYLGFVRGARLNDQGRVEDDVFLMHLPHLSSMRTGPDGYVYGVTAIGDKGLFRLILKQPVKK